MRPSAPRFRHPLAPVAVVVLAVFLPLASAQPGGAAPAGRTVTLSKSAGINNGEKITVSWTGLPPGYTYLHQCERGTTNWKLCSELTRVVAQTDASGNGSTEFTVWGMSNGQAIPSVPGVVGPNDPLYCQGNNCSIYISDCSFDLNTDHTVEKNIGLTNQGNNPEAKAPPVPVPVEPPPVEPRPPAEGQKITGSGSSDATKVVSAWQDGAIKEPRKLDVDYASSNSPSGLSDFIENKSDYAVTSMAFTDEQIQALKDQNRGFVYVPVAVTALTVSASIQVSNYLLPQFNLSADTGARIYTGQIFTLNQSPFTTDNRGCAIRGNNNGIPSLVPIIRGDQSSASLVLTSWFKDQAPQTWKTEATPLLPVEDSRFVARSGDKFTAEAIAYGKPGGGSDVESAVLNSERAARVSFIDRSTGADLGLMAMDLKNRAGNFVAPTDEAVLKGINGVADQANGFRSPAFGSTDPGAYPLGEVIYVVAATTANDSFTPEKGAVLKKYLEYVLSDDGQKLTKDQGSIPLPADMRDKAKAQLEKIPTPTNPEGGGPDEGTAVDSGEGDTGSFDSSDSSGDDFTSDSFNSDDGSFDSADSDSGSGDDRGSSSSGSSGSSGSSSSGSGVTDAAPADGGGAGNADGPVAAAAAAVGALVASLFGGAGTIGLPILAALGLVALAAGPYLRRRARRSTGV